MTTLNQSSHGFVPEHLYFTPEFDRALKINSAMLSLGLHREGLCDAKAAEMQLLRGASLAEMLESQRLVDLYDDRPQQPGSRTYHMKCDDRLIAAVYTFLHYGSAFRDEIVLRLDRGEHVRFLMIGSRRKAELEPDDEDDEEEAA